MKGQNDFCLLVCYFVCLTTNVAGVLTFHTVFLFCMHHGNGGLVGGFKRAFKSLQKAALWVNTSEDF